MELVCEVQKYHWGLLGLRGHVAQLCKLNSNHEIDKATPYAELWMGTHPNGPSRLKSTQKLLSSYFKEKPSVLGEHLISEFGESLPFLFKVLSVNSALSIQAHPTKKHAEVLHMQSPENYKDPNHKPEVAVALTSFKALCGFRPLQEVSAFINSVPELNGLIDEKSKTELLTHPEPGFKNCFKDLMSASSVNVSLALTQLLERFKSSDEDTRSSQLADLAETLHRQYPGDVGVFCIYFLNYLELNPGEALYLAPNEPHAYLHGECVECMSNSDNVVRAGLTPKFRDVPTLCDMLTYKHYEKCDIMFTPIREDEHSELFSPPVKDFAMSRTKLPSGLQYNLKGRNSASILIVVDGHASGSSSLGPVDLSPGVILFLPASEILSLQTTSPVLLFQAFANV